MASDLRKCALIGTASWLALMSAPTRAQAPPAPAQTAPAATEEEQAALRDDAIVVTGIRGAIASAINQKRNADVIIDGISADDIGNIPDLDLGEALVRIPGVQIDRDAERRGSSISVRGLPASFTKTTVLGQNIAAPSAARFRVNPFGAFDSSVFSGANVIKSFSADIQTGGLGANVDLQIRSALARKDGQVDIRAELGYEELPEAVTPGLFVSASKHLFGGTFGLFGTVAYSKQRFRRDIATVNAYRNLIAGPTTTNPTGVFTSTTNAALQTQLRALDPDLSTPNDYSVLVPSQVRQFTEQSGGYRLSAAGGFEWRPFDGLSFRTDILSTRRDLNENELDSLEVNLTGASAITTPAGTPINGGRFNAIVENVNGVDSGDSEQLYYFPEIQFSNPTFSPGNRSFNFFEQTFGVYPQITYENDRLKIQAIGAYSEAKNEFVQEQFQLNVGSVTTAGATNGITGLYNSGNGDIGGYVFDLALPANAIQFTGFPAGALTGAGTVASFNSGRNSLQLIANNQRVNRSLYSGQFDVEYQLDLGPLKSVKAGGRYQRDDALNRRQNNSLLGTQLNRLTADVLQLNSSVTSGQPFFNDCAPGYLRDNFLSLDLDKVRAALLPIDPARLPAGASQNFLSDFYQALPLTGVAGNNWESQRDNAEGYALARFDHTMPDDIKLRGNIGIRYTKTDVQGNLLAVVQDNGFVVAAATEPVSRSYESWLPSANLIVDITDTLVFNAAFYETYEALDLTEFSPAPNSYTTLDAPGNTTPAPEILDVNLSALDRDPRTSKSGDLGLTWYNRTGSLIGINLFYKNISSQYEEVQICPEEGVDLFVPNAISSGALATDSSGICRTTADLTVLRGAGTQILAAGSEIRIDELVPSSNRLKLKGIEAQIQQNLSFVDGWMSGFGVVINGSYVHANRKIFGVSEYTYNLIGYYETEAFSIRLARNTRASNLLPAGGGFQGGEREVRGRSQLDLSLRVTPMKGFDIRLEGFNLTNAQRREYEFLPGLARRTDYDGRTYSLSVQVQF